MWLIAGTDYGISASPLADPGGSSLERGRRMAGLPNPCLCIAVLACLSHVVTTETTRGKISGRFAAADLSGLWNNAQMGACSALVAWCSPDASGMSCNPQNCSELYHLVLPSPAGKSASPTFYTRVALHCCCSSMQHCSHSNISTKHAVSASHCMQPRLTHSLPAPAAQDSHRTRQPCWQ